MASRTRPYYLSFRVNENEMQKIKNKIAESGKTRQDFCLPALSKRKLKTLTG